MTSHMRDVDLIRLLLLDIEGSETVDLSQYSAEQIGYHKYLLDIGNLVEGNFITQKGLDFLDISRIESAWKEARKILVEKDLTVSVSILQKILEVF